MQREMRLLLGDMILATASRRSSPSLPPDLTQPCCTATQRYFILESTLQISPRISKRRPGPCIANAPRSMCDMSCDEQSFGSLHQPQ